MKETKLLFVGVNVNSLNSIELGTLFFDSYNYVHYTILSDFDQRITTFKFWVNYSKKNKKETITTQFSVTNEEINALGFDKIIKHVFGTIKKENKL